MAIQKYPIDAGLVPLFCGRAPRSCRTNQIVLPYTEAAADANTFVCEFLGGANANETGVGMGLTGADLVLTQVGSVGASSGGFRALTAAQGFACTAPFAAAFLNTAEWTYALRMKSATLVAGKFFWVLEQSAGSAFYMEAKSIVATGATSLNTNPLITSFAAAVTSATDTWVVAWLKSGKLHFGWVTQASLPTGWDDFPATQRGCVSGQATMSGTWNTLSAVGYSSGGIAMSVGALVASKVGLSAAPT